MIKFSSKSTSLVFKLIVFLILIYFVLVFLDKASIFDLPIHPFFNYLQLFSLMTAVSLMIIISLFLFRTNGFKVSYSVALFLALVLALPNIVHYIVTSNLYSKFTNTPFGIECKTSTNPQYLKMCASNQYIHYGNLIIINNKTYVPDKIDKETREAVLIVEHDLNIIKQWSYAWIVLLLCSITVGLLIPKNKL